MHETIKNLESLISTVGFPVVTALYFMARLDRRIDRILDLIEKIAQKEGV